MVAETRAAKSEKTTEVNQKKGDREKRLDAGTDDYLSKSETPRNSKKHIDNWAEVRITLVQKQQQQRS